MSQGIPATDILSATPNIPLYYSHYENGMYYYNSTCCIPEFHYGFVASTQEIPPHLLGCVSNDPISGPGVGMPGGPSFAKGQLTNRELEAFLGNGNIGNSDTQDDTFHLNPVAVKEIAPPEHVMFSTTDPRLNALLDNRTFRLRSLEVTLLDVRLSDAVQLTHYVAICVARPGQVAPVRVLEYVAASPVFTDPTYPSVREGRLMIARLDGRPLLITNNVQ